MSIITPDWVKDAVFYQIFPDRFAKSDRVSKQGLQLEPWESPPTSYGFKGGDLLGIVEHLDYLQDLGINALYLNPITASASNHRYHTYDYLKIDPLLGGDAAFRELLDSAHARGIRVVPDGVFNHASRGFWQFHHVLENGRGSPYVDWFFFNPDQLDHRKHWGAYPGTEEQRLLDNGVGSFDALGYQAWWNLPALPKLNTNNQAVRDYIYTAAVHWIEFGADGWRLDVPAEINDDLFWQEFRRKVKSANPDAYIVGEIWHESQRWLQGDQFDAVMNYLVTGALMSWLIGDRLLPEIFKIGEFSHSVRPMNAEQFADRINTLLSLYDPEINAVQFNLLDSHDTPRFLTTAREDLTALKLGWLFLFTYVGTPCLYYGDEIGMVGGSDPDCRKSFIWDNKLEYLEVFGYAKSCIGLRNAHVALRRGSYQLLYANRDMIIFLRRTQDETLIVAINASYNTVVADLPAPPEFAGGRLVTVWGEASFILSDGWIRDLRLAPRNGAVLGKAS
jgi:cyclomaltodextrinase / maltogenic alpha-amylase / neopullulanase